jgi:hypothetical protein
MDREVREVAESIGFVIDESEGFTRFSLGCMGLSLCVEHIADGSLFPYLAVRAKSAGWHGDSSDITDITSYLVAAYLQWRGIISCQLVDIPPEWAPYLPEMDRRYLVPRQPIGAEYTMTSDSLGKLLWEIWDIGSIVHGMVGELCAARDEVDLNTPAPVQLDEWAAQLTAAFPQTFDKAQDGYRHRASPHLFYYRTADGEVSITRSPEIVEALEIIKMADAGQWLRGEQGEVRVADGLRNVAPREACERAAAYARALGDQSTTWENIRVLPFENAMLCVSDNHVVLLNSASGRGAFLAERDRIAARRQREAEHLFGPDAVAWRDPIDDQQFEDVVRDLLGAEPSVVRIQASGPSRGTDRGRDLTVWMLLPRPGSTCADDAASMAPSKVVVQCKAKKGTVGPSDVPEIRDVIEDANAQGFLLVAANRVSAALTARLENIEENNGHWARAWDRAALEERLRRNPEILARYPGVATAAPAPTDTTA